jgi:Rieske Fe-S protein
MSIEMSRRNVVRAGVGVSAGLVLVGCGGSDDTAAPAAAASTQPAPASSAASSEASSPAAASGASGTKVVALADVPVGGSVAAEIDGKPVLLAQPTAGKVVCFSAKCTHRGCTVAPAGAQLKCPCHGSVYTAATGAVEHGPAPAPLTAVPVEVSGSSVVTA